MFAIDDAKFPPPSPAVVAASTNIQYGVAGFSTHAVMSASGTSSSADETVVQFRPPNRVTAAVYGIRIAEPTRLGSATSQNNWSTVNRNPAAGRLTATALHSSQIENPMCSTTIDQIRLRRATRWPVAAQNDSSSGSHRVIHRPLVRAGSVVGVASVAVMPALSVPAVAN